MSKVMETEYIMHIKGTDPYPKGDILLYMCNMVSGILGYSGNKPVLM